jgi:hypothetical protein
MNATRLKPSRDFSRKSGFPPSPKKSAKHHLTVFALGLISVCPQSCNRLPGLFGGKRRLKTQKKKDRYETTSSPPKKQSR